MVLEEKAREVDNIQLIQHRFELITLARYRDKDKIMGAAKTIDKIRQKTKGKGAKSMTETVRKWRDARHGPSSS